MVLVMRVLLVGLVLPGARPGGARGRADPVAVWLVAVIWMWWLIGRRVRSFGYAERADDLLVTSGIMFRRLVVVPYGRMQLVDITAGPLDRRLGVATVQLHTAAAIHERHDPRPAAGRGRRACATGWRPAASSGVPGCDPATSRTGTGHVPRPRPGHRASPDPPADARWWTPCGPWACWSASSSSSATERLRDLAAQLGGLLGLALVLGALAVADAGARWANYLAWTRTEYFFDESGDFRLDSGVLQRNERRVTLSRLQSVDTTRPLLGRVVGLSQVRIEVAGGGDSRVAAVLPHRRRGAGPARRDHRAGRRDVPGRRGGPGGRPRRRCRPATWSVSLLLRSETMLLFAVIGPGRRVP